MNLLSLNIILPLIASISAIFSEKIGRIIIIISNILLVVNNLIIFYNNNLVLVLANFLETYQLALASNNLANAFALMVSFLYLVTNLYSFAYLDIQRKSNISQDLNPKMHFFFMPIAVMAALNIGYSANLITLFVFYEILTLSTYPLVIQSFSEHAKAAGKYYLWMLFGSSSFFLIIALMFVDFHYGDLTFKLEGVFSKQMEIEHFILLLICFVFGFSKTAIFPLYKWLPKAMVAPVPVSALLHAVAVVKAGVFALIKIFVYFFGIGYLKEIHKIYPFAIDWLTLLACFTIIFAGIKACMQTNLKKILAYSTISQLSYMILALSFINENAVTASFFYMLAHSVAKITLFFVAGIIYLSIHKVDISDMQAIVNILPIPVILFALASLSIIGLPLSVGFLASSNLYNSINCDNVIGSISMCSLLISKLLACFYFSRVIFKMLAPSQNLPICYIRNNYLSKLSLFNFIFLSFILFVIYYN